MLAQLSACWKVVLPQALQRALLQSYAAYVPGLIISVFYLQHLSLNVCSCTETKSFHVVRFLQFQNFFCLSTAKTNFLSYFHAPSPQTKNYFPQVKATEIMFHFDSTFSITQHILPKNIKETKMEVCFKMKTFNSENVKIMNVFKLLQLLILIFILNLPCSQTLCVIVSFAVDE